MNLHTRDVEERAKLLQALKAETEDIKNRLVTVSARCHELETIQTSDLQVMLGREMVGGCMKYRINSG